MKLAFYIADGEYIDTLIRLRCSSLKEKLNGRWKKIPSHVELVFSDGMWFSSSPRDGGARFKKIEPKDGHWKFIDLHVNKEEELIILEWCKYVDGKLYDWSGVFGFVVPFLHEDPYRLFCSETCVLALQQIGKLQDIDSGTISPRELLDIYEK